MHHHTPLIFVFFVETGFCHVAQVGLKLLSSSDLLASTSHTGMSPSSIDLTISAWRLYLVAILYFSF